MIQAIQEALALAGVPAEARGELANRVAQAPPGSFDPEELTTADPTVLALLASIVAAEDHRNFGDALRRLIAHLVAHLEDLSRFDQARLWHIRGFAAWRLDEAIYPATYAFNRSLHVLKEVRSKAAVSYAPRVFDTFGQLLQHQGHLRDAQIEFENALRSRDQLGDEQGVALTLGNLGRLSMDLGEFANAAKLFERDVELVERISPENTLILTQLMSHLGCCYLELGDGDRARQYFDRSEALAQEDDNVLGLAFVAIGRGGLALAIGDSATAASRAADGLDHCERLDSPVKSVVIGLLDRLRGETALAMGDVDQACDCFHDAKECFEKSINVSPIEMARVLQGYAEATYRLGDHEKSNFLLRKSLLCLDATSAHSLRQAIETKLRTQSLDSWLLHSAGRFVGQQHIEFLLEQAGNVGFRGSRKEVCILFSDIRSFTTIGEGFRPETLVVFLNDYLGLMTRSVEYFGGMVDKFIGDAVMALFSLPESTPLDGEKACLSALMMLSELESFNRRLTPGRPPLRIGVGIHAGDVVAGLIGTPQKRSYTVIGDAVNTASRLEGMTKFLGGAILVTQQLVDRIPEKERFLLRPVGAYYPMGRDHSIEVFELLGQDDGSRFATAAKKEIVQATDAVESMRDGRFGTSRCEFEALAQAAAGTRREVGYRFLERTTARLEKAPPEDWDGAIRLSTK